MGRGAYDPTRSARHPAARASFLDAATGAGRGRADLDPLIGSTPSPYTMSPIVPRSHAESGGNCRRSATTPTRSPVTTAAPASRPGCASEACRGSPPGTDNAAAGYADHHVDDAGHRDHDRDGCQHPCGRLDHVAVCPRGGSAHPLLVECRPRACRSVEAAPRPPSTSVHRRTASLSSPTPSPRCGPWLQHPRVRVAPPPRQDTPNRVGLIRA